MIAIAIILIGCAAVFSLALIAVGIAIFPPAAIILLPLCWITYKGFRSWVRSANPNSRLAKQKGPAWTGEQFAPRSIHPQHPSTAPSTPDALDD